MGDKASRFGEYIILDSSSNLDIIIPVYNEGESIIKVLNEVNSCISHKLTVYVVYDFDEDSTLPTLYSVKDNYDFPIIPYKNNLGRGVINALKAGFEAATADYILVIMADLSDRLSDVNIMIDMMNNGYDLVCGSRYMKGGKKIGGPFWKGLFSRIAGLSLHFLTRIPTHDITNSFKLYSKKVIDSIDFESTGGFEIGMEITVKAYNNGFKIGEVPTSWQDRVEGESNFKTIQWIPHYLHWYFYCIKNTWFR